MKLFWVWITELNKNQNFDFMIIKTKRILYDNALFEF